MFNILNYLTRTEPSYNEQNITSTELVQETLDYIVDNVVQKLSKVLKDMNDNKSTKSTCCCCGEKESKEKQLKDKKPKKSKKMKEKSVAKSTPRSSIKPIKVKKQILLERNTNTTNTRQEFDPEQIHIVRRTTDNKMMEGSIRELRPLMGSMIYKLLKGEKSIKYDYIGTKDVNYYNFETDVKSRKKSKV